MNALHVKHTLTYRGEPLAVVDNLPGAYAELRPGQRRRLCAARIDDFSQPWPLRTSGKRAGRLLEQHPGPDPKPIKEDRMEAIQESTLNRMRPIDGHNSGGVTQEPTAAAQRSWSRCDAHAVAPQGGLATDTDGSLLDMPRDLAHTVSADLLDVVTLLLASKSEVSSCDSDGDGDADGMTGPSSRAEALIAMAECKVRGVIRAISPYV